METLNLFGMKAHREQKSLQAEVIHALTSFNYSVVPTPLEKAVGTEIRVAFWNVNRRLDQAGAQNSIERISAGHPARHRRFFRS